MNLERQTSVSSVDQDETPQNAAFHLGLHLLSLIQQYLNTASGSNLYLFKYYKLLGNELRYLNT